MYGSGHSLLCVIWSKLYGNGYIYAFPFYAFDRLLFKVTYSAFNLYIFPSVYVFPGIEPMTFALWVKSVIGQYILKISNKYMNMMKYILKSYFAVNYLLKCMWNVWNHVNYFTTVHNTVFRYSMNVTETLYLLCRRLFWIF